MKFENTKLNQDKKFFLKGKDNLIWLKRQYSQLSHMCRFYDAGSDIHQLVEFLARLINLKENPILGIMSLQKEDLNLDNYAMVS